MESVIRVEGLGKKYTIGQQAGQFDTFRDRLASLFRPRPKAGTAEEFWALRDISFEVPRGEVLGIIGRNGAGKSTLLKIFSRITEPTEGEVMIDGRVASLLEVGTGFHPELTGRENVFLNGAILGMSREEIRRKFDEIVAFAEIEKFLDTPVKRYSSGMYVRLAFAVAAHLDPEILIVDEVLAVGDMAFQKKCLDRMRTIATREQRTVLMVSHNLNVILQFCTKVALLSDGKLLAFGDPAETVRQHLGAMNPSPEAADLASRPRPFEMRAQARLLDVRLTAPTDAGPWSVPFGDAFTLEFRVRVLRQLEFFELGLGIFNLQGLEICSSLSSWTKQLGPLEPGEYLVQVAYPTVPLVPGTYRFGVGLRSERDMEDYLPEAFDLEITPSSGTAKEHFSTIRGALVVEIATTLCSATP